LSLAKGVSPVERMCGVKAKLVMKERDSVVKEMGDKTAAVLW